MNSPSYRSVPRLSAFVVALASIAFFAIPALFSPQQALADTGTKTITGTIKNSDGTRATDASVNAFRIDGFGNAFGHVDGNGVYTMLVTGGTWQVQPQPDTNAKWMYSGSKTTVSFDNDTSVESKTLDFSVTKTTATISGHVMKSNGTPVTSGNLQFRTQDGKGGSAFIGSDGSYTYNTTDGTFQVFFWTEDQSLSVASTTITVKTGDALTLDLTAKQKNAHIKGKVSLKTGAGAPNVRMNAFQMSTNGGGGGGEFSQATTDGSGNFDISVLGGADYGVNIGMGPDSNVVPLAQKPFTVTVATDSTTVTDTDYPDLDFVVVTADATITGSVLDSNGEPVDEFSGCVYARLAGAFNDTCGPVHDGTFTVKVSSDGGTSFEIGVHTPPNSPFSGGAPVSVTVTPNGSVSKNITLVANNSSISGSLVDSTGFPVKNFKCHGSVFVDSPSGHYQGEIKADGSYRISLVAGTYRVGAFYDKDCGALNQAPSNETTLVLDGQSVQKNITIALGDATISGKLVDANGNGVRGFVMVDNHGEINNSRELGDRNGGNKNQSGSDVGFNKQGPCGATDVAGVMKCCGDAKNKTACQAFAIPDGPNGCKNAYTCTQECKKNANACKDQGSKDQGPQAGKDFTGPGGCKSEDECKTFCSKPENATTCQQFKPPENAKSIRVATKSVKSAASVLVTPGKDKGPAGFDNAIRSGSETDSQGNFSIKVLSGHKYTINAGLPPGSGAMPPKSVDVDLTKVKTATVLLQLRKSDATLSGTVTINGTATSQCGVHAWAEDGGNSFGQCGADGSYTLNLSANTIWHVGADSLNGSDFYHSGETAVAVVTGTTKYTKNFALEKGGFDVPQPVSSSFSCNESTTITLNNGTTIEIPAGAVSTSTTGTCSVTVTPTADLRSMKTAQPFQSGYTIEARDENGAAVTSLLSSATITFAYDKDYADEQGQDTSALGAGFYDTSTGSWNQLSSCTVDTDTHKVSCSTTHFSSYSLLSSTSASNNLKAVTLGTKKGLTTFTVSSKTVTPFLCKGGTTTVKTASLNGKQYIVAGSTCDSKIKVYDTSAKLKKTLTLYKTQSIALGDFNNDGSKDIAVSTLSGTEKVTVYDVKKSYKKTSITVGSKSGAVVLTGIEAETKGTPNIVVAVDGTYKVYSFKKGKYSVNTGFTTSTLSTANNTITFTPLKPTVTSASPKSITHSATVKTVKVNVFGTNFTKSTTAIVCSNIAATVKYKSSTKLELSLDASQFTKGQKCTFALTNTDGGAATSAKLLTIK